MKSVERMQEKLSSDESFKKAILFDISRTVCNNFRVYQMFMEVEFWLAFLAPISHSLESFSFSQYLATLYRNLLLLIVHERLRKSGSLTFRKF